MSYLFFLRYAKQQQKTHGIKTTQRLFFSFLFLSHLFVVAQRDEFIRGQLLDAKTLEPIVFASIRIKDRALGVISNLDGSFRIPMKYQEYGDIIEISSMGYRTKELLIHDFSRFVTNTVRLQPAVFELSEATVSAKRKRKRMKPREIVQKAIDALLENYPTEPYVQVGYYRDYQLDNDEYVNLNEAIMAVHDQGFDAIDSATTRAALYDYKANLDFRRDTLARKPYNYSFKGDTKIIEKGYLSAYGGNEFTILSVHNAIRNHRINSYSFVHRFDTDLLKEHSFSRDDDSSIGEESLYTIKFIRKLPVHTAYGRLYISKSDYSIFKMDYAVYDETKNNKSGVPDKNGTYKQPVFEVTTSYRRYKDKMYLNYISFNNVFKIWEPPKLTLDRVDIRFDNAIHPRLSLTLKKRWIVLTFSEFLNADTAKNTNQFNVHFKGKKIALEGLLVADNQVVLYPKVNTNRQIEILDELEFIAKNEGINEEILKVKTKGLKDLNGNAIGRWTTKDYHQFREFFVQEVKADDRVPEQRLFMNNRKPIFDEQPIVKPDNFGDYWMNTPLKTINN